MGKKQKQRTTITKRSNNSIRKPVHFPNLTTPFFMFNHKGLDLFRENEQESYKYGSMHYSKTILNEKWFICLVTGLLGQD